MCSETEEWLYDDGRAADRDAFVAKKKAIEVGQGGPSLSSPLSLASLPRLSPSPRSLTSLSPSLVLSLSVRRTPAQVKAEAAFDRLAELTRRPAAVTKVRGSRPVHAPI